MREERDGGMTEGEIRELCNRFFDAYQDRRVDELARDLRARLHHLAQRVRPRDDRRRRTSRRCRRATTASAGARTTTASSTPSTTASSSSTRCTACSTAATRARCGSASSASAATARSRASTSTWTPASSRRGAAASARRGRRRHVRKDWNTLALCDRFFDAIEQQGLRDAGDAATRRRRWSGTATTASTSRATPTWRC